MIVVVALLAGATVGIAAPSAAAVDPVNAQIDLRILVVSTTAHLASPSFEGWTTLLDREGVPYDVFDTSTDTLEYSDLASGDHAFYQGIVCATRCSEELGIGSPQAVAVQTFLADFGLRRINAYAFPDSDLGLNGGSNGDVDGDTLTLTTLGHTAFPYLDGDIPIDDFTFGHYGSVINPANFEVLAESEGGAPVLGVYSNPLGFSEMVLTIDNNQYQTQSLLLGHGMLSWLTNGLYLGYNRNYFSGHIDDVFLPDDRWDIGANTTHEDDGVIVPLIRMVPGDVTRMKNWMTSTGIRLDMVFNGFGSDEAIDNNNGPDPLTDSLLAIKDELYWINHTYRHENLDPPVDQATIAAEIADNILWAAANGVPLDAGELVTGQHSGLGNHLAIGGVILPNPALEPALSATGIDWIAADNSVQPDPYDVGSARTIPRYPANVFYNTATRAEQLDEYIWLYVFPGVLNDDGDDADGNCAPTPVTTCLDYAPTWEQYVDIEASIMLPHLITNDPRPHYFHQANLAEDGVFYDVFGETLSRYEQYFDVPLEQPHFRESGEIMERTSRWHNAKSSVTAYLKNGAVYLTSPTTVQAPLTGVSGVGDLYGSERSGWVTIGSTPTVLDWIPPQITLLGATPVTVGIGEAYTDAGATATDNVPLANAIVTVNSVNTAVAGSYTVTYNITDNAGNPATEVVRTVNVVDTDAPTQIIDTPTSGQSVPSPVSISGMANDNGGVSEVRVTIQDSATSQWWNGTGWQGAQTYRNATLSSAGQTSTGWSYQFNLGALPPSTGPYNLSVTAHDGSGLMAIPSTRSFSVAQPDTSAPVIHLVGANPQVIAQGGAYVELGATATDNQDVILSTDIAIDATGVNVTTVGAYQVTYNVTDSSGNAAEGVIRTVNVIAPITPVPGMDSPGLVDPTTGVWWIADAQADTKTFYFGDPGDLPFMGDWNCDGIDTPGLYRQSDGYVYLRNSNSQGVADITFFFGNPGDVPLAGDFNSNGCDTVGLYRPSEGRFFVINALGSKDQGLGKATTDYIFGNPGDVPFAGDFDGDGVDTFGLYRTSTGLVYMRNAHTQGNAHASFIYGDPNDRFVTGDWNADSNDSPGVFRPSDRRLYLRYFNSAGNADVVIGATSSSLLPVSGHFGDLP